MIRLRGNFLVPTAPDPDNAGVGTQIFFIFAFIIRPHFLDVFFLPRPPVAFKVVKLKTLCYRTPAASGLTQEFL